MILASMRTYARRYVAALFAVVIATAFIVSINALSSAARDGASQAVQQQYGRADLVVTGTPVPADAADADATFRRVSEVPGVDAVALNWLVYSSVSLPGGRQDLALGSIADDPALRWQRAASGRLPRTPDEVALSASTAQKDDVSIGDTVTLRLPEGERRLTVTGTVDSARGNLSASLYLPEDAFAGLGDLGSPQDAVVAVTGDPSTVQAGIERVTGPDTVDRADAYREVLRLSATDGVDAFQKLIYVFAGVSMFVGALVIANTFTILLAQRARDLALLRCVGALRSQVARSVVLEGVLLGVVGSALGVLLGLGLGVAGTAIIGRLSPESPMGSASPTLAGVVIPVVLGVAVTAVGCYLPARRAGSLAPLAALQPQDGVELRSRAGALRLVSAAVLLVAGCAGLVLGLRGSLTLSMAGGMLSFVGVLLLSPVLVPAAIRAVGPLARRLGLAGRLAHVNSLRNPRRTAATSTALLIGVTLITTVVVATSSLSQKIVDSTDESKPLDLIAVSPAATIPDGVTEAVRRADGVRDVETVPAASGRVDGHEARVLAVGPRALDLVHDGSDVRDLAPDQVVVPWSMVDVTASEPGDRITVTIDGHSRQMEVLRSSGIGDDPLVSTATLASMGVEPDGTAALWVRASAAADPGSVVATVSTLAKGADLDVQGGLTSRADAMSTLNVLLMVTIGLLAVAVLIALVGVANTLSLSVLERVRENSLLRAIGLDRSGLRRMLAFEALLMAGVSAVLGVALGVTYAWFGIRTLSSGVFPTDATLVMPWGQIGLILVVAACAGLAACVLPARRAARIAPAAGLVAD
jgi:putative ABC transport system permease protein